MKALLIDGLNLVRRIHAAVPEGTDQRAHLRRVIDSISASLARALDQHEPTHVACVFDSEGPSWRHELFPAYKSKRPPMPALLRDGRAAITTGMESAGVRCLSVAGFEADDVIASMAARIAECAGEVLVLSTDTSFCQLLNEHIRIYDHFNERYLDTRHVHERFGVEPAQLRDLMALVGSQSSSIPGIRGIGIRTARRLLGEYATLQTLLDAAPGVAGRTGALLVAGREDALMSQQLVRLRTDVHIGANLSQFRRSQLR